MKPVAVLGVGPAGLMAAHAVAMTGRPVALFSQPDANGNVKKSVMGGAQFLHEPIPHVNDSDKPDAEITYQVVGDTETYRRKVYGDDAVPFVSMEGLVDGQVQRAWNLRDTYDRMWELLSAERANVATITATWIDQHLEQDTFDWIISSIPAPAICRAHAGLIDAQHAFVSQTVVIWPECILGVPDNTVVYDGTVDRSWYRCSSLWGIGGTEWSDTVKNPPVGSPLIRVKKPLHTNCRCFEDLVVRVGRYGEWKKGVLTHHAFTKTLAAFT
jgi:hypothetical protein